MLCISNTIQRVYFPRCKWSVLSFSKNFPDLEIHDPNNRKTHVSEISQNFKHVHERLDAGNRRDACL